MKRLQRDAQNPFDPQILQDADETISAEVMRVARHLKKALS